MKSIFLLVLSLSGSLIMGQNNIVKNGGFNQNTDYWRGDVVQQSSFIKKEGQNSGMILQYTGEDWKGVDQIIAIPKGTYAIELSAWIKSDEIAKGKQDYNAGVMTVELATSSEKSIEYVNIAQVKGTTDWTLYSKIILIPENAKKIRIMLALAQTSGTIFFDDIKAVTVSEDDYLKIMQEKALLKRKEAMALNALPKVIENTNFENELKGWNGSAAVSTSEKKEGNAAASISSTINQWTAIDQSADVPEDAKSIEISGWLKAIDIKQGIDPWNNGMFILELTRDGKSKTIDDQLIGTVTSTTDWTFFKKIISIPSGTKNYRIMLALSNCTGTLLADDLQVNIIK